ncbi:MAG TPA: DNA primase, partial [Longilinea sp.]|nr:DNA primase [Longilinea sp.]
MQVTDEIKSRLDIVELVSQTVKLRRTGKNYIGFCPFHSNTHTPAFVVFPDSGTWRCFGQCNEGGDIFKYVMKKEGWDFPAALKFLADKAGVKLEAVTPERQAEEEEYTRLRSLMEEAVTFYRSQLLQNPAGQAAARYLEKRGLTAEAMERFGLGYAPDSWDAVEQYLTGKGYSHEELIQAGMLSENPESGKSYDRFRNRITFPIRDMLGKMTGFGARILNPEDQPKFLNSPQTALFDKGRLLYGLDQARKAIRAADQVVIVEGYLDVIALHQTGFTNTVSPMGTALTEDQLRVLKRLTRRIVLALDADAAGEKATLRGLEVARQTMDHSDELGFDARGLLRHEARLQADVRVTTLPPGADPDEVALKDPEEWKRIIESAKPIVVHVMDTLTASRDIDDPKTKSEIAAQVMPLIEDVPNAVERDAYRQKLARLLRIDERALVGSGAQPGVRPRRRQAVQPVVEQQVQPTVKVNRLNVDLEKHCLRLLLRQPEVISWLDRQLQRYELARFTVQDFENSEHQALARVALQSLNQDDVEPAQFVQENIPEEFSVIAGELMAPAEKEFSLDKQREDLVRSVSRLRSLHLNDAIDQMRYLQQEAQEQGEQGLTPYQEMIMKYMLARGRLERLENNITSLMVN